MPNFLMFYIYQHLECSAKLSMKKVLYPQPKGMNAGMSHSKGKR